MQVIWGPLAAAVIAGTAAVAVVPHHATTYRTAEVSTVDSGSAGVPETGSAAIDTGTSLAHFGLDAVLCAVVSFSGGAFCPS